MRYARPVGVVEQNQAPAGCAVAPAMVLVKYVRCDKRSWDRWSRLHHVQFVMGRAKPLPRHAILVVGAGWCERFEKRLYPSLPGWIMATRSGWREKDSRARMAVRMGTFIL